MNEKSIPKEPTEVPMPANQESRNLPGDAMGPAFKVVKVSGSGEGSGNGNTDKGVN
jgi:hypothetical protein